MNTYSLHKKALMLYTCLAFQAIHAAASLSFQGTDSSWKALEYYFKILPQERIQKATNHGTGALGVLGALYLVKHAYAPSQEHASDTTHTPMTKLFLLGSGLTTVKTMYNGLLCAYTRTVHKEILYDILQNWEQIYRPIFPAVLITYFDTVHQTYLNNNRSLCDSMIAEIFHIVTYHVDRHFNTKLEDKNKKSSLDIMKHCTDIWKNIG